MAKHSKYILKSLDTVGYPDALEDDEFLRTCFVDSGYIEILADTSRPERILLGRTGAGKSALLEKLLDEQGARARRFLPETLSLQYVSNSPILTGLQEIGVNFDLFFNLLWKHVFAVELIRWRFDISDQSTQRTVVQNFISAFNPTQRRAFEYLQKFGDKFWIESNERVLQFARQFEFDILSKLKRPKLFSGNAPTIEDIWGASESEQRELRDAAQSVVDRVQTHYLTEIVDLVRAVLHDEQRKWYIVIDKLDENWVDDRFKAQLIRALLDTIRSFAPIKNLKIIVALRYDLIDRVFRTAMGSGAQREKYQGQFLHIRWLRPQLTTLLDKRINQRIYSRYSQSETVTHKDVFPREITRKKPTMEWVLDRTLLRPRDLIAYTNLCLKNADGNAIIPAAVMRRVEGEYSKGRLEAVFAEWEIDYTNLRVFIDLLKSKPPYFVVGDVTDEAILDFANLELNQHQSHLSEKDDLLSIALKSFDLTLEGQPFRQVMFSVFYQVGFVGLKISNAVGYSYSYEGESGVSRSEITDSTRVAVHPCFMRSLGIGRPDPLDASRI